MSISERIKYLRTDILKLSRVDFCNPLGISVDELKNIELGRLKNLEQKESLFRLICTEYDVNLSWLKTGNGDPLVQVNPDMEVLDFMDKAMNCDDAEFKKRFIVAVSKMTEEQWTMLEQLVEEMNKK